MSEKIEVFIKNVDLQLKTIGGKMKVFGKLELDFSCNKCHELCEPILKFDKGEHPDPRYNCEHCEEKYLINNTTAINPSVEGSDSVKLYEKTKLIMVKNSKI